MKEILFYDNTNKKSLPALSIRIYVCLINNANRFNLKKNIPVVCSYLNSDVKSKTNYSNLGAYLNIYFSSKAKLI